MTESSLKISQTVRKEESKHEAWKTAEAGKPGHPFVISWPSTTTTNTWDRQLLEQAFILAHSFVDFDLWLVGPVALGLWWGSMLWQGAYVRGKSFTLSLGSERGEKGPWLYYTLQGYIPNDLKTSHYAPPLKDLGTKSSSCRHLWTFEIQTTASSKWIPIPLLVPNTHKYKVTMHSILHLLWVTCPYLLTSPVLCSHSIVLFLILS
jgi:hypothetical protein